MILGGIPLLALAAWQEGAEAPARLAQLTGGSGLGEGGLLWQSRFRDGRWHGYAAQQSCSHTR